jgi:hypothetical protein
MRPKLLVPGLLLVALCALPRTDAGKDAGGVTVDKAKRTVTIDAKVAPRKLEHLDKVYPLEVIACWPHPKGKKAHETIVTIDAKPSAVHKGLEEVGLKPGRPVMGEGKAQGPEVKVYLEVPEPGGETRRLSIDKTMLDSSTGKAFPKDVRWLFTGSAWVKADPTKDEEMYGADYTGTLGVIFPVSDSTVMQSSLPMKYEKYLKLETNPKVLPKVGTPVKLVLEAVSK